KAFTVRYFLPLSLLLLRNPTGFTRILLRVQILADPLVSGRLGIKFRCPRRGKPRCLCFLPRKTTTFRRFLRFLFSGSRDRSIVVWHLGFRSFSFLLVSSVLAFV
ncbi:unnamed protein product, partial [Musa textilis]